MDEVVVYTGADTAREVVFVVSISIWFSVWVASASAGGAVRSRAALLLCVRSERQLQYAGLSCCACVAVHRPTQADKRGRASVVERLPAPLSRLESRSVARERQPPLHLHVLTLWYLRVAAAWSVPATSWCP
jgi:hypothetical protein